MAQQPTSSSTNSTGGSGGKASSSKEGKTSRSGSKVEPLHKLANVVPAHHAKHGMSGEYRTKGKFGNWPDGNSPFGE